MLFDPNGAAAAKTAKAKGARRLERWLAAKTGLPRAVAMRVAHDSPELLLSATQIVCTTPGCAPIETLIMLQGGADGAKGEVLIPKPIAEVRRTTTEATSARQFLFRARPSSGARGLALRPPIARALCREARARVERRRRHHPDCSFILLDDAPDRRIIAPAGCRARLGGGFAPAGRLLVAPGGWLLVAR